MTTLNLQEPQSGTKVVALNIDQYQEMIAQGILLEGEPIELLDGILVYKDRSHAGDDPMTVAPLHAWIVKQLENLGPSITGHGCHIRIQFPILIPPRSVPEPDASIVVGSADLYIERHPSGADVLCVVEVSDSSLNIDRTSKQQLYAGAGIGEYFLINIVNHTVEVRTLPRIDERRYANLTIFQVTDQVSFPLADGNKLTIPVAKLFPKS
jgi:Uma2 family endonuclease